MDARELLGKVAQAYRNLTSLEARATAISESHEDGFSHTETPVSFFYVAPGRFRLQHGNRGMTIVSDGQDVHTYFPSPKRYAKTPVRPEHPPAGEFNPQFPYSSNHGSFLFGRIAERIAQAEVVRDEPVTIQDAVVPCQVVSVIYEQSSHRGIVMTGLPILFWISTETHLVLRTEIEATIEFPRHGPRTTKHTLRLNRLSVDQPIESSTFSFAPPPDAEEMPAGRGWVGGIEDGGGGWSGSSGRPLRSWHSNSWDGNTLIEQARWTFRGHELKFERRWTLSGDGVEIQIAERIDGPKGATERSYSIPVA